MTAECDDLVQLTTAVAALTETVRILREFDDHRIRWEEAQQRINRLVADRLDRIEGAQAVVDVPRQPGG